jgi:hypothetical protein
MKVIFTLVYAVSNQPGAMDTLERSRSRHTWGRFRYVPGARYWTCAALGRASCPVLWLQARLRMLAAQHRKLVA